MDFVSEPLIGIINLSALPNSSIESGKFIYVLVSISKLFMNFNCSSDSPLTRSDFSATQNWWYYKLFHR